MRAQLPSARRTAAPDRRGAVVVEMAFISVLLVTLVLGMIEVSRGLMVREALNNAVRAGCRVGCQEAASNDTVLAEVRTVLQDNNINPDKATVTVRVAGQVADVSTARRYDRITVAISLPASEVSWVSFVMSSTSTIAESAVMMRQS